MNDQLLALATVLHDLTVALETGRAADVQAVEPRLVDAIDAVRTSRASASASVPGPEPASIERAELLRLIRARVATCRRLGGTVPALMSVMFPGQTLYGRHGLRLGTIPVRPSLAQVL